MIWYWNSPTKCHVWLLHWLKNIWCFNYTSKAPVSLRTAWKNDSRMLPSNSRWGLRTLDPVNPWSEKMTKVLPSQPFFTARTPQNVINLELFYMFLQHPFCSLQAFYYGSILQQFFCLRFFQQFYLMVIYTIWIHLEVAVVN